MSYSYNFSGLSNYFKDMGVQPATEPFSPFAPSDAWLNAALGATGIPRVTYDLAYSSGAARWVFTYHWDSLNIHSTMTGTLKIGSGGKISGSIGFDTGEKYSWSFDSGTGVYSYSNGTSGPDYTVLGKIDFTNDGIVVGGTFSQSDFTINDLYSGAVTFYATSADAHFTLNYARGSFSYGIANGVDRVFGSFGDDMIFGNGGLDNLGGGSKDDVISINGGSLGKLSGGSGFDTLQITGNINLSDNILRGFEQIDLGDGKNAITVTLSEESLIWSSVMRGQTLTILGDSNDRLNLAGAVKTEATDANSDGFYDYTIDFAGRSMVIEIDTSIRVFV